MRKKLPQLAHAGLGVAAALAACGTSTGEQATSRSYPVADTAGAVSGFSPPASSAVPGTTRGSSTRTKTAPATSRTAKGADGCTVTIDTLTAALRASNDTRYSKIPARAPLESPECFGSFATVRVVPKDSQPSRVLFTYETSGKSWRPVNAGSAGFCNGYAPNDVAAHLTGCN